MESNIDWKQAFLDKDAFCTVLQRAHTADEQTINELRQSIIEKDDIIAKLQSALRKKKARLAEALQLLAEAEARIRRGIIAFGRDWDEQQAEVSSWLEDLQNANYSPKAIKEAYRKACRANNESCNHLGRHGLRYRAPLMDDAGESIEFAETNALVCDPVAGFNEYKRGKFDFSRLLAEAPEVMAEIVRYTMQKDGPLHVVFRLDKYDEYPPRQGGLDPRSHLPFRFFWGEGACAVNSAPLPRDVLAPLLVNRTWLEIFGTCFYATNTFSFQSLGEFDLFFVRLGAARRHRIQHIELWWHGSSMPKGKKGSDRTWALRHFVTLRRLKTLKTFLNESKWLRRPNEPEHVTAVLARATKRQVNCRMFRDLRAVRGKDYVYQLRGMSEVKIFDYMADVDRTSVQDDTFVRDMRVQIMSPKSYGAAKQILVEKLQWLCPELRGWVPTMQVMALMRNFMDSVPISNSNPIALSIMALDVNEECADVGMKRKRRDWNRRSDDIDVDDGGESRKRRRETLNPNEYTGIRPLSRDGEDGVASIEEPTPLSSEANIFDDDVQFIRQQRVVVDLTDDSVKKESINPTGRPSTMEEEDPFHAEELLSAIEIIGSVEPKQTPRSPPNSRLSRCFSTLFVSEDSPSSSTCSSMLIIGNSNGETISELDNSQVSFDEESASDRARRVLEAQLALMHGRSGALQN